MFVYDMALELGIGDDVAVAELEVLNEETGSVERLVAADTSQLLIDLVALSSVSHVIRQDKSRPTSSMCRCNPDSDLNSCPHTRQALLCMSGL